MVQVPAGCSAGHDEGEQCHALHHCYRGHVTLLLGEEWYKFRQAVQQDMMRVSSAMLYINSIQDISEVSQPEYLFVLSDFCTFTQKNEEFSTSGFCIFFGSQAESPSTLRFYSIAQ